MENHAKARSDERLKPNRLGRPISVDWGSGSPVQIRLLSSGGVKHGVASTDSCMNNANASVLTAKYRPRTRNAGNPTRTATTAVTAPANGSNRTSGTLLPRCAAMIAPTATSANCPNDTCPAQPVSTVSDSAITP